MFLASMLHWVINALLEILSYEKNDTGYTY